MGETVNESADSCRMGEVESVGTVELVCVGRLLRMGFDPFLMSVRGFVGDRELYESKMGYHGNTTFIPSTRFSKMNWLNFHYDHCSKLAKNTFETIIIGDSIVAGLSRYQNVRNNFLKPLKALNCGKRRRRNSTCFMACT